MKALITGGTGLLGRALLAHLPDATVLTRAPGRAGQGARAVRWDPEREPAPAAALAGVDAVFNLAGEPIADGRWTEERKRSIRDSRVLGTRNLVAGLAALDRKPAVLISASAVGYYGDRGDEELDETSPAGQGFLPGICTAWEHEAMAADRLGIRVVCARIGIVLSPQGGALARMLPPFRLGAGARLGNGRQWMSWIHLDDVVGALLHASRNQQVSGPMNVVSPHPATNAALTRALGQALHRPAVLMVPKAALWVAYGEMGGMLTESQRVLPGVATRTGFEFKYPRLDGALAAVLAAGQRTAA